MESNKPETKGMRSPKQQLLRDPDIQPTDDVIAEALGEANNAYMEFVRELAVHDIQLEWRYYTDGKAWLGKGLHKWTGARGGQKEITVFWLSIWDGFFKLTFYIPEKSREDVLNLPLADKVSRMITDSKQMGNKLKFFPLVFDLYTDEKFGAIFFIVDFKKRMK